MGLGTAAGAASDEAFRLVNAEGDGLPGFTADVYGAFVVISVPARGLLPLGRLLGETALELGAASGLRWTGAVVKVRGKDPQDRSAKEEILGESPPKKLVVRERGVPFEVHLLGALNVGLFTDMREHRRNIGRFTAGRRVLNTFAYTGALSVAAALAGRHRGDQRGSVHRRAGLGGGELPPQRAGPEAAALPVRGLRRAPLPRAGAGAAGWQYDTIILDPPDGVGRARLLLVDEARLPGSHRARREAAARPRAACCGCRATRAGARR